jgi:hypothetical protein
MKNTRCSSYRLRRVKLESLLSIVALDPRGRAARSVLGLEDLDVDPSNLTAVIRAYEGSSVGYGSLTARMKK